MANRDQLRQKLADAIANHAERCSCCPTIDNPTALADALLPEIDAHVQAERERIEKAIHAHADKGGMEPNFEFGLRFAADRIVRGGAA